MVEGQGFTSVVFGVEMVVHFLVVRMGVFLR